MQMELVCKMQVRELSLHNTGPTVTPVEMCFEHRRATKHCISELKPHFFMSVGIFFGHIRRYSVHRGCYRLRFEDTMLRKNLLKSVSVTGHKAGLAACWVCVTEDNSENIFFFIDFEFIEQFQNFFGYLKLNLHSDHFLIHLKNILFMISQNHFQDMQKFVQNLPLI